VASTGSCTTGNGPDPKATGRTSTLASRNIDCTSVILSRDGLICIQGGLCSILLFGQRNLDMLSRSSIDLTANGEMSTSITRSQLPVPPLNADRPGGCQSRISNFPELTVESAEPVADQLPLCLSITNLLIKCKLANPVSQTGWRGVLRDAHSDKRRSRFGCARKSNLVGFYPTFWLRSSGRFGPVHDVHHAFR